MSVEDSLRNKVVQASKGDRGEVAAAAWIGLTLDTVRSTQIPVNRYNAENEGLSCPVDVIAFLQGLGCELGEDLKAVLRPWRVNLTHFCRMETSPDRDILDTCWKRHAGLYMIEGEEGIDLLMVMKEEATEKYSTVRIQVKNYKSSISQHALDGMLEKLDVRRCAPRSTFEEEKFSIAMVVQVGTGEICQQLDTK